MDIQKNFKEYLNQTQDLDKTFILILKDVTIELFNQQNPEIGEEIVQFANWFENNYEEEYFEMKVTNSLPMFFELAEIITIHNTHRAILYLSPFDSLENCKDDYEKIEKEIEELYQKYNSVKLRIDYTFPNNEDELIETSNELNIKNNDTKQFIVFMLESAFMAKYSSVSIINNTETETNCISYTIVDQKIEDRSVLVFPPNVIMV